MNVDLIRVVAQNTRRQRKRIHEILPAGIRQILDHLVVNHVLWSNRVGVDRLRPCDDFDFLLQSFGGSQREFHGLARFESYFGRRLEITFAAYRDAIGSKGKSIEAESPIRLRLRVHCCRAVGSARWTWMLAAGLALGSKTVPLSDKESFCGTKNNNKIAA